MVAVGTGSRILAKFGSKYEGFVKKIKNIECTGTGTVGIEMCVGILKKFKNCKKTKKIRSSVGRGGGSGLVLNCPLTGSRVRTVVRNHIDRRIWWRKN